MLRLSLALLAALAVPASCAALQGQAPPSPGNVHDSADGRFRWVEGDGFILVADGPGKKPRKVPLPPAGPKPAGRQILFAERGRFFCLLDADDSEFGLHLDVRRGAKDAKALVLRSTLRLVDDSGRVLWSRETPEKVAVSPERAAEKARSLRVANNGTLAILLQDVDPYDKARPVLLVIGPRGKELLRLDYATWASVDEFVLSEEGKFLALRGFAHIPQEESWGKALGIYSTSSDKRWIKNISSSRDVPRLLAVDSDGWACCGRAGNEFLAFGKEGQSMPLSGSAAQRRFGIAP